MRKIEILAPAGSRESLEAAVKAGADAVYLAGQQFGARKSAQNFTTEELIEVIGYCHLRGVKVYLTVNTLISDSEMEGLIDYLKPLYESGLDAFIVQDFGAFKVLREAFRDIEIHCSTQMALHEIEDVQLMKELGASRVVVPRELSTMDIKGIKDATGIEIEAFVHGALCVSVSGQCLMSSMIGGRSGNRGSCAQSCRQKYKLLQGNTEDVVKSKDGDYLLSPKDLMTLDRLEEIIRSGVDSLKIEGRMKGPEYTYTVTKAYREALDQILIQLGEKPASETNAVDLQADKVQIERIFNREFTEGFILEAGNKDYIGQETPGNRGIPVAKVVRYHSREAEVVLQLLEDLNKGDDIQVRVSGNVGGRVEYIKYNGQRVDHAKAGMEVVINFKHEVKRDTLCYRTYDQQLMKSVQLKLNDLERTTGVELKVTMKKDAPMVLYLIHESGISVVVESEMNVEKALKTPLSTERILEQLEKMGGTSFRVTHVDVEREGDETLPIKALNQLRRDGALLLTEKLLKQEQRRFEDLTQASSSVEGGFEDSEDFEDEGGMTLSAMVRTPDQYRAAVDLGVKRVYIYNAFDSLEATKEQWQSLIEDREQSEIYLYLGRFVNQKTIDERFNLLKDFNGLSGILAGTVGQLKRGKAAGYKVVADFNLNVFNHEAEKFMSDLGADGSTYSLELNEEQLKEMTAQHYREKSQMDIEFMGYGLIPVMVNTYCPINGVYSKDKAGCQLCRKNNYYLEDKTGAKFLVKGDSHCQVEIFNGNCLNLADEWYVLDQMGMTYYRLNFVNETREEAVEAIETHLKAALGHTIELRGKGFTKGHFKRGVL